MTDVEAPAVLDAVFRALRDRGVPLGIRDYCDAIRALRLGFGGRDRYRLRFLCRTLWARTDDERRLVDMMFETIPPPSSEESAALSATLEPDRETQDHPTGPLEEAVDRAEAGKPETPEATLEPRAGIEFVSRPEASDLPLPRLDIGPLVRTETFILEPQASVPERMLAVLWRRFRRLSRVPHAMAGQEVDIAATVAAYSRRGILADLVHRPGRVNTARLLILADASPSMAPWVPLLAAMSRSLVHGRLQASELLYFSNWPRRSVFRSHLLTDSVPLDAVLRAYAGAALLILSDAGSARASFDRRRLEETDTFLHRDCRRYALRPVVWINPVPSRFWARTTADALRRRGHAVFLPLDEAALIRAIDVLRGAKAA